jgi:hypothetical protein
VYRRLALAYNYTPNQIAEMTPHQQDILLRGEVSQTSSDNLRTFKTIKEFQQWQTKQK